MTKRAKKLPRAPKIPAQALVSVVDDDESVRESLPDLLTELGFAAKAFASANEFLTSDSLCDALSDSGHRHARHVRTGVAARVDSARARDRDHFHHRSSR